MGAVAGQQVEGYEIHMGQSTSRAAPAIRIERRLDDVVADVDGAVSTDGLVIGTYLHGIFANVAFRRSILAWLAARKGRALGFGLERTREAAYDQLAETVRQSLDLGRLRTICGL